MRYFGTDGAQCQPPAGTPESTREKCHHLGRALLFGRVPRSVSLWMGAGVLALMLLMGMCSLATVQTDGWRSSRDTSDVVTIRR